MEISTETKELEDRSKIRKILLNKINNMKIILNILEGEIINYEYDKITDSISTLNIAISSFINELKKL